MKRKHGSVDNKIAAAQAVLAGISVNAVAKSHGKDRTTIFRWVRQYKKSRGRKSLSIRPRTGRPRKDTIDTLKHLENDLQLPASQFGFETDFWTARRVLSHLNKKYNLKVSLRTVRNWLRQMGLTYKKPERRFYESSPKEQERWIKTELPEIKKLAKKKKAILYFEDEASIKLTPVVGKTWSPRGKKTLVSVTGNRGSLSAISAISASGSLVFGLKKGKIASKQIINFLARLLCHHKRRNLVVVMDRARPHTSKMTKNYIKSQKRLDVFYLPARSPSLNPDEKVWRHLKNEELRDHKARSIKELSTLTRSKLAKMSRCKRIVKGIFYTCDVAKFIA